MFGDVFAGWAEAAHQQQQNLLQMDYENKRALAEHYAKLGEDDRFPDEQKAELRRRAFEILTLKPGKAIPSHIKNMTLQVQPPAPAPVQIPGSSETAPS